MKRVLRIDFVRFCIVGTIGFLINFALLTLFYKSFGLPIFVAQIIASEVALFNNFLLHHNWTYKGNDASKMLKHLVVQFHVTSWVAIVGSALLVSFGTHTLGLNYGVALIVSSAIALFWNYFWTKYVIWKRKEH